MNYSAAFYLLRAEPFGRYADMSIDERRARFAFYTQMLQCATHAVLTHPSDPRAPLRFVIEVAEHAVRSVLLASCFY